MSSPERLGLQIAGIQMGLEIQSGWHFSTFRPFSLFSSRSPSQIHYQVSPHLPPGPPEGELSFDSGQSWRLFSHGDRRIFWIGARDFTPSMVGNFGADFHSGDIYISPSRVEPGKYTFPLGYPLGELLMTSLLGTGYGIMLHSCGVIDGEDGFVFAGISTAGKSTTARLWSSQPGTRVINDDHTILRKVDGQFRLYGTPWHGEGGFALAEDAPLKKILILRHAPKNQAVRLSPARAAAALLVRTFAPLWSAAGMNFTLQFLDELCQSVPCYELGFVPDSSAVEFVRCLS
jgi:hypothetical protein